VVAKVQALEAELVAASAVLNTAKEEAAVALQAKQDGERELAAAVGALKEAEEQAAAAMQAKEEADGARTTALAQSQMSVRCPLPYLPLACCFSSIPVPPALGQCALLR